MKTLFLAVVSIGVLGGSALYWFNPAKAGGGPSFRTAPVAREELVVAISATGTVEPEEVVDVGAQVAGRIIEFGQDRLTGKTIDYGSLVEPGTVLARIDDAIYKEEVNVAKAQLAKAEAAFVQTKTKLKEFEAGVERAAADLRQMQSRLAQSERDLGRVQKLGATGAMSKQEIETFRTTYETSEATVGVGKAALLQAQSAVDTAQAVVLGGQADVEAAQAALNRAERNLAYTTIESPISGVIIDRRVNIGQTVVASLNAPSLFLIAKDLKRIQVWASVNEADIGRIVKDQTVRFTVDAFPGETFLGAVSQIRLNASMTQNVVTYTVIVNADNADGRLLPYLTANLQFEVSRHPGALVVPNAALRWRPRPDRIAPEFRNQPPSADKPAGPTATVWVVATDNAYVRPVTVRTGVSDSGRTQVISDVLREGAEVVLCEQQQSDSKMVNPLTPKMFNGRPSTQG